MKVFFQALLYISLGSIILSIVTSLSYEIYAAISNQLPPISLIAIPWVKAHNIYASLIVGAIMGFLTFLIVHFFGART